MTKLKDLGTEKTARIYQRRGSGPNTYGVSVKDRKGLQKELKKNQNLAEKLWETGIVDAQMLACAIIEPKKITFGVAENWVNEICFYELADAFSSAIAKTQFWKEIMFKWMKSDMEYIKQCGYDILASKLSSERKKEKKSISISEATDILKTIEKEIHDSPNRARHTMNGALISLGSYISDCTDLALEIAENLGVIEVDHGETGCVTPVAAPYIRKTINHINKKKK